jgi:proline iminopeptidase
VSELYTDERGNPDGLPLVVLHGGPGLDHTMFGSALDPLGDAYRLLLVDERATGRSPRGSDPSTWTLEQHARDLDALGEELGRYAVLGHSFGAFIALQHAVDTQHPPAGTIVSAGAPSERWLEHLENTLNTFEPEHLREQVAASWAREQTVETEDGVREILRDQLPFHFADPEDPRIAELDLSTMRGNPDVLRHGANEGYGNLDVEARLGDIAHPVLIINGAHDRLFAREPAEFMAARIPGAQLAILEHSAHMGFIEEPEAYLGAVRRFLDGL